MSESDEPREVSIKADINESGLTVSAKSRAVTALDNLVGDAIGFIGQTVARVRQRSEHQTEIQRLDLEEDLDRRAQARALRDEARKQENRETVALFAVEELKQLPPPDQNKQFETSDDDPIDPDWLNAFSQYAEQATTERLRVTWAKVIAGEIRQPGTFSLSTLRVLSELDTAIARRFAELAVYRIQDSFIPRKPDTPQQEYLDMFDLEDAGLIQGVTALVPRDMAHHAARSMQQNGDAILVIHSSDPIRFNVYKLTKIGREICKLLQKEPDNRALLYLAKYYGKIEFKTQLGVISKRNPDGSGSYEASDIDIRLIGDNP